MLKKAFAAAVGLALVFSSASTAQASIVGLFVWAKVYRTHHHQVSRDHGSHGSYGSVGFHHWGCWSTVPHYFAHRFAHGPQGRFHGLRHRKHGAGWGHGGGHAWMRWQDGDGSGAMDYAGGGGYGMNHEGMPWGLDDGQAPYGDGFMPYQDGEMPYDPRIQPLPPAEKSGEEVLPPPPPPKKLGRDIRFQLAVPFDAMVFVNDEPTASTGELRPYVSRNLDADAAYSYTIRAEVVRDGKRLTQEKTLKLTPGADERVAFEFPKGETPATALILRLPADARVLLAGVDTKSSGETREFLTTRLTQDQWANYPIRVELTRDGRTLVYEQTVTLSPGDRREVKIDFDSAQVASTR